MLHRKAAAHDYRTRSADRGCFQPPERAEPSQLVVRALLRGRGPDGVGKARQPMLFAVSDAVEADTAPGVSTQGPVVDPSGPPPAKHMAWIPGGEFLMGSDD